VSDNLNLGEVDVVSFVDLSCGVSVILVRDLSKLWKLSSSELRRELSLIFRTFNLLNCG